MNVWFLHQNIQFHVNNWQYCIWPVSESDTQKSVEGTYGWVVLGLRQPQSGPGRRSYFTTYFNSF